MRTFLLRIPVFIVCLFFAFMTWALACQVPVFRYALERWTADKYELAVFCNGELSGGQEAILDKIGDDVNLEVVVIDVEKMDESDHARFGDVKVLEGEAFAHLYYPWGIGNGNPLWKSEDPLWKGTLTAQSLARIVDSPARKAILQKTLAGESAVWVIVESGDAAKDAQAEDQLRKHLDEVSEWLEIPEGVVGPGELDRVATGEVDVEDVLRSTIPLKISFDVIRLNRDAAEEEIFVKMLTAFVPQITKEYPDQPLIFPVFGRGRTLDGIPASIINKDLMASASSYLCGACSCEVKRENPGIDLVMTANWADALVGSEVVIDKILPPLEGVGDIVGAIEQFPDVGAIPPPEYTPVNVPGSAAPSSVSVLPTITADISDEADQSIAPVLGKTSLPTVIGIFCAVVVGGLAIVTLFLKRGAMK